VPSTLPKPHWTLTGTVLEWPDGELAPIRQSPWTSVNGDWAGVISVPRGHGERLAYHTLFVLVRSPSGVRDDAREHARSKLAELLRGAADTAPIHLGEITL
jgi:hypothetical protein